MMLSVWDPGEEWLAIADLAARGDFALRRKDWDELAAVASEIGDLLGARPGVLTRAIVNLVREDEGAIAGALWEHVSDIARDAARRGSILAMTAAASIGPS